MPYRYNPKNIDDLVKQYIDKIEKIQQAYPNKPVVIRGLSLGGAIATKVAAHFHNKAKKENKSPPNIKLFNDQSFSSITNVVCQGFIGKLLYPVVKLLLLLCGWEINAAKYYKQIPDNYKTYVTFKYKSPDGQQKQYDTVLGKGSLHRAVQAENKEISKKHKFILDSPNYNKPFSNLTIKEFDDLKQALTKDQRFAWLNNASFASRDKIRLTHTGYYLAQQLLDKNIQIKLADNQQHTDHGVDLNIIKNRVGITGIMFFQNFAKSNKDTFQKQNPLNP